MLTLQCPQSPFLTQTPWLQRGEGQPLVPACVARNDDQTGRVSLHPHNCCKETSSSHCADEETEAQRGQSY